MAIVVLRAESRALAGNPLGDPHVRDLHVVVPDDWKPAERLPCVWYLSGYAGVGRAMLSHDPWQEGFEERLVRLRREGKIGRILVALPDAFTKYGGCQYLGSSAVGDYETYLLEELRALVEARFSVSAHAIAGKSSGGYAALVHAMRRPGLFAAVVCHSGDMGFQVAYGPEIAALAAAIHDHGGVEAFVRAFERTGKKREGRWLGPISALAMASVYSPDPQAPLGIAVPFDSDRGELDPAVFDRWLALDPLRLVEDPAHQEALRRMALVFIDVGRRDEHHLQLGARALHKKLDAFRVPHVYAEFDDGHRNTSYRLDESLPQLFAALSPLTAG